MSTPYRRRGLARALDQLAKHGLLLGHDALALSVTRLVTGEQVRGSWWSHPRTHDIYWVYQELHHRDDVQSCKLVAGKLTFVGKALWPALLRVATSNAPWQRSGLSPGPRALLLRIEEAGVVRTDALPRRKGLGDRVRELEKRLLVYSDQLHTESGAHAKRVEAWEHWRRRHGLPEPRALPATAEHHLERAAERLYEGTERAPRLPWTRARRQARVSPLRR